MTKRHLTTPLRLVAAVAALLLALVACGGGSDSAGGGGGGGGGAEDKNLNIGVIEGWTDYTSTAALLSVILKDQGWNVKTTEISDNAPLYAGLARGDIDLMTSSWMERTQKSYWDEYGKDLTDLGAYYNNASLFLAVPDYSNVKSIEELPQHAAEFGNRIVGIEPGAGLTKLTQENVIPDYALGNDYKLVLSSTAAMLTELKKATEANQAIVVTLWKPFWANQSFPVRALEDPKKAYGDPENLHEVANKEYAASHPELANMLAHFKLDDKQYGTLEDTVVNKFPKGQEEEAARAWLEANPGYAEQLVAYLKKP
jgi:glycine betaine/proline transport system substrate-binding protein